MSKYHVNDAGDPGDCNANRKCPFGSDEEHYSSMGEARSAYEEKMSKAGSTLPEMHSNRLRDEAVQAYVDKFPQYELNATEKNIVEKALEGKKVSDEKIDKLLDAHFDLERIAHNRDASKAEAVQKVFRHLRNVRKKSGTPSTLVTGNSFDPSMQSVYSNKDARKHPSKMAKAISREASHGDWMRELADRTQERIDTQPSTLDEENALKGEVEILKEKARRSDARCQAMMMELKWKMTNDTYFAGGANLSARAALNRYKFNESLKDVPIGTVRKVSEDE